MIEEMESRRRIGDCNLDVLKMICRLIGLLNRNLDWTRVDSMTDTQDMISSAQILARDLHFIVSLPSNSNTHLYLGAHALSLLP